MVTLRLRACPPARLQVAQRLLGVTGMEVFWLF